jgi:hypothetical protein
LLPASYVVRDFCRVQQGKFVCFWGSSRTQISQEKERRNLKSRWRFNSQITVMKN